MKKRLLALALLCAVLLSGCSMLERSYVASTPHVAFSDEDNDPSILRAETYQGLVSALLHLVGQGKETGFIRLYQFASITGSAVTDVDRACLEVTQKDPLGAWAVDYIKYDVEGSDAQALDGSTETIRAHKPDLLLSLYHRTEDIFALPLQLHALCPEYRLYIRRYPYIPAWDLNLYASVKGE